MVYRAAGLVYHLSADQRHLRKDVGVGTQGRRVLGTRMTVTFTGPLGPAATSCPGVSLFAARAGRRFGRAGLTGPSRTVVAAVKEMTNEFRGVADVFTALKGKNLNQEPDEVGTCRRGFGVAAEGDREVVIGPRVLNGQVQNKQGCLATV